MLQSGSLSLWVGSSQMPALFPLSEEVSSESSCWEWTPSEGPPPRPPARHLLSSGGGARTGLEQPLISAEHPPRTLPKQIKPVAGLGLFASCWKQETPPTDLVFIARSIW